MAGHHSGTHRRVMDGWRGEWEDGQVGGWVASWMDGQVGVGMGGKRDVCVCQWTDG